MKLGFIGFGEAPHHISRDFVNSDVEVRAFDVSAKDDSPRAQKMREHAAMDQVTLVTDMAELIAWGDVFFCFTSADVALPIARQAAPLLRPGQFYLDMNTTSPQTKREIAAVFADSQGDFVEGAVMASGPVNGSRVPVSVCGAKAKEAAELLNSHGMKFTYLSDDIGLASATKALRSVLAKGIIALVTETVFATDHYHITEEVLDKMKVTMFDERGFMGFCHYCVASAAIHNGRFCHEMEEVLKTLDDLGENSIMTQATLKKFEWLQQEGYAAYFPERAKTYDEVLAVANIGDNMNRIYCVDSAIRSMNGKPMLGVAYTLHLPSGDNLLLHKAIEMAQPGDVLLISAGGPERAYCGELMMMDCRNHGFAGCAIDGYLRDIDEISHMDFPVFARGITPQCPYKFGPGEINVPIAFGGQVVFPGDIVIGDTDGMIFVRPSEAEEILEKSWKQHAKEDMLHAKYDEGATVASYNEETREATLAALGCQVIEGQWK